MEKRLICLVPIKNEEWILEKFLNCASVWADNIIVLDQKSEDSSKEIAKKFSKVILVENPNENFSESERQKLLINKSRKLKNPKILIALDADEIITSNSIFSKEWELIKNATPGTIIRFKFVNITPDLRYYWCPNFDMPWGYVDDGKEHCGNDIHSFRVPFSENSFNLFLKDIKIMHFQYTDWQRMQSKHRWYQCWERINNPQKSSVHIYRAYNHMYSIKKSELHSIPEEWFSYYLKLGIDLKEVVKEKNYYWDKLVLEYFEKYGTQLFRREDLWYIDWEAVAKKYNFTCPGKFKDPRNILNKLFLSWLKKTQYNYKNIIIRVIDKILVNIFKF